MKNDVFSPDDIRRILRHPHLIGHLVGKTKLTELHSRWIHEVWDEPAVGNTKCTAPLMAHRGAYKTTACTEIGCIYWLLLHPNDRIALIRATWSTANDTLKTIAAYMANELVQELFRALHDCYPVATTNRDGRLTFNFKGTITKEGSIDAYGIDTVPTGSHYDEVIGDDFVVIEDRFSRAKRERTKYNLLEIVTHILDPGKRFHAVGTPWHKEDAWTVLPPPRKYTCYDTGIMSPEDIEQARAGDTDVMFAANYLLEHKGGSDMLFQEPEKGDWLTETAKVYAHLDASYVTGRGRDTTALTIGQRRQDGAIQMYGMVWHGSAEENGDAILRELRRRNCRYLTMEDNGDKGFLAKILRRYGTDDGQVVRTVNYHEKMNKHTKIVAYLGHHWHDLVWAQDTDNDYLSQVCDYMEGASPDDAPDSAASLLREVFFPQEKVGASWKGLYAA